MTQGLRIILFQAFQNIFISGIQNIGQNIRKDTVMLKCRINNVISEIFINSQ